MIILKFKPFILTILGFVFIGISIGFVFGFYVSKYTLSNYFFYLAVLPMALGCSIAIYSTMFTKR
jgi:hypothetical protein